MSGQLALVVLALTCCVAGTAVAAGSGTTLPGGPDDSPGRNVLGANETRAGATILDVYPNPPTDGDVGEFVTIRVPPGVGPDSYVLTDGHSRVSLAPLAGETRNLPGNGSERRAATTSGQRTRAPLGTGQEWLEVTLSTAPKLTRNLTDRHVVAMPDHIQFANDGDSLEIRHEGAVVDAVAYSRAPQGAVYDAVTGEWEPLGATDRPVVTARGGGVEAFVLPDSPDRAVEFLESAEKRVLLAGYTLSSDRIVRALLATHRRGVAVSVLADGRPVGGLPAPAAAALDRLSRAGIPVSVVGSDRDRYEFHHAKYAVVDDRALVTSENWKPSGTGGRASRGWGVVTNQSRIVEGLAETFRADTGWVDSIPWEAFDDRTLTEGNRATGSFPETFTPELVATERVDLLLAPDNAEREILALLADAERTIDIKQVSIADTEFPFVQAVLDAARRGVEVRVLLAGAWYVEEENRELAERLRDRAEKEGLSLAVRIADPDGAFEKIHAKGVIVDGNRTLVGSLNWNNNSLRDNREVALVLHGEEPAAYFGRVFEADWQDDGRGVPIVLVLVGLVGVCIAVLGARRLEWER
ncbi:MAG: phospholipase D-like domain-containing protein [Halovenus sp.]